MTNELKSLQGVWFPTHLSSNDGLNLVHAPSFPDSGCVPLLTIHGEHFHTTSTSMGHWSGGRVLLTEVPRRRAFDYAGLPEEFCSSPVDYQLVGDELLLCLRKTAQSIHRKVLSQNFERRSVFANDPRRNKATQPCGETSLRRAGR